VNSGWAFRSFVRPTAMRATGHAVFTCERKAPISQVV
jgi:hypothetical protein